MTSEAVSRAAAQFRQALWIFAAAMCLHELEEWNIAAWFARNFPGSPGLTDREVHLGLFLISAAIVAWVALATRLATVRAMAWAALPLVLVVGAGNSLQHIAWTIRFSEYAPGVVAATVLVLPACVLVVRRALVPGGAPTLYVIALAGVAIAGVAQTWAAGHRPLPALEHVHTAVRVATRVLLGPE